MYKLVAIDLDGTLLNSYGEISQRNKNAIKKSMERGIQVIIASGRPITSAKSYANESGANNYMVCGNGSILYDVKNDEIIYDRFIERLRDDAVTVGIAFDLQIFPEVPKEPHDAQLDYIVTETRILTPNK